MKKFSSADEILDFAIDGEQQAHDFYMDLASKMKRPGMDKLFQQFAQEEARHKAKLIAVKEGKMLAPAEGKITDLKIGDYLVEPPVSDSMDYQDALILAMKREKAAYKLYNELAGLVDHPDLKASLLALAQEEAKHKLRFEIEYDDFVLKEN